MYKEFFNLYAKPFELIPNPEFLFLSKSHKKAMTYLDYGIKEKIGFVLLTGEVGSGKTTVIRNLVRELNSKVRLSKIFNTKVSSEQLIAMINEDFGISVSGKDKVTMIRELNNFLIGQYADNYQSILIIDEAQNLTPELLEEVRLLSNLETDESKLLQIILVGQPELRKILAQPEMRQLRQRISVSCHIRPLTREETEEYIFHRFEIAGNRNAVVFHDGTIDIIYKFSRGIPRLINIICDFLLLSAFVEEKKELSLEMVKEVIGEIETDNRYWQDEAPENYISANKDFLQEIVNRLCRVEEEFFKRNISQSDKIEIFERLSASENLLKKFITNLKTELDSAKAEISVLKKGISAVTDEINTMRDTIKGSGSDVQSKIYVTHESELTTKNEKIKRGFLKRLFRNAQRIND